MIEILIFLFAPALLVLFDFVKFISTGKRLYPSVVEKSLEVILIIGYPLLYLGMLDSGIAYLRKSSRTFLVCNYSLN